jgi:hypothetical protein
MRHSESDIRIKPPRGLIVGFFGLSEWTSDRQVPTCPES